MKEYYEMFREMTLEQLASVYNWFTPDEFWHYVAQARNL